MKKVYLHIDRLVLKGFCNEDRTAIAAGIQEELARQLASTEAPDRLAASSGVARLRVDPAPIRFDASAQAIGVALAGSVVRGMTR